MSEIPIIIEERGAQGEPGATGATGPQGLPGPGIVIKGSVPLFGNLPSSGNSTGDAYIVESDGKLYIWDGNSWENVGPIVGPTGPTGPSGGPTGPTGPLGPTGPAGSASAYAPEIAANWNSPIPATIEDALDQLAARVKALEP